MRTYCSSYFIFKSPCCCCCWKLKICSNDSSFLKKKKKKKVGQKCLFKNAEMELCSCMQLRILCRRHRYKGGWGEERGKKRTRLHTVRKRSLQSVHAIDFVELNWFGSTGAGKIICSLLPSLLFIDEHVSSSDIMIVLDSLLSLLLTCKRLFRRSDTNLWSLSDCRLNCQCSE